MKNPTATVSPDEIKTLRGLAQKKAAIAALPVQQERRQLWTRLNRLEAVRPPIWIFEIPWHEMEVDHELQNVCRHPLLLQIENGLRQKLYQWNHMPGDMVVDPFILAQPVIKDTGFGLEEKVDTVKTDENNPVVSRHFIIQIKDEADIEKIQTPKISHDREQSEKNFALLSEIFDGVIRVEKGGVTQTSIAPWDFLVRLTGVEEILMDMHVRPEYVHRLMTRLTQAHLAVLDQYEALGLLALNNNNTRTGGGLNFTNELPAPGFNPAAVRPIDMWGRTMSQIFASVSPAMHEEFALQYECQWLKRFGLAYYGCCEPLHQKVGILRRHVPNLRKISMSPWINLDEAAANVGQDYVFSLKANPSVLATGQWNPEAVREELRSILKRLKGLRVEIIMKDISTVRHDPRRLWEWEKIARQTSEDF
ncbi:MAG: uroporphyrinogen decarboxylase family protein [Verrucomicrobiae bacterium]|nr:uroporphyrinogen decarboxylase family protein [Verrucomicrobiae bacterium]